MPDSALGGVLLIEEADRMIGQRDRQSGMSGAGAVQALSRRAEQNRDHLVIILTGNDRQMEAFLASAHRLASWFGTRIRFPRFSPTELMILAVTSLGRRNEILAAEARPVLWGMLEDLERRRLIDEVGNGWFIRNLLDKATQARDLRVLTTTINPGGLLKTQFEEI
jgi:hypothetical protein